MIRRSCLRFCLAAVAVLLSLAPMSRAWAQTTKLPVVASFSILADFVARVGGDRVEVSALVGPNGDAHGYSPNPADAARVAGARVVVTNGLGFESWIDRLVKASGTKAVLVVASKGVKPIEARGGNDHGHGHGHAHGGDPHAWQDVANVMLYVAAIRDALASADPAGRTAYEENARLYTAELDRLDAAVRTALAAIPAASRKVITSHDAFGYFAKSYDIRFIAPRGISTESEPSAQDVARIVRQIKAEKVAAVFLENMSDPRLMERIAKETGARVGGRLFSDALSEPGGPAPTYVEMMRHNARTLAAALAR